jgi:hypothetical protein
LFVATANHSIGVSQREMRHLSSHRNSLPVYW